MVQQQLNFNFILKQLAQNSLSIIPRVLDQSRFGNLICLYILTKKVCISIIV